MSNLIGIDKLSLWTQSFSVPTLPKMIPSTNKVLGEKENVLIITGDGQEIRASKLYVNTKDLKVCSDIKIRPSSSRGAIDRHMVPPSLSITLNPNKHYHDYKGYSSPKKLKQTLEAVRKELKEIGIISDPLQMSCTRIDLNRDQELSKSYDHYKPLFDTLGASRKKINPYATGVNLGNGQSEVVVYSKSDEYFNRTKEYMGGNLTRCEARLLKSGKIRDYAPYLSKVYEVVNNYDYKDQCYRKLVGSSFKSLETSSPENQLQLFNDSYYRGIIEKMVERKQRSTMLQFLSMTGGISFILENYATMQEFNAKVIDPLSIHREKKRRLKIKLNEIYTQSLFVTKGHYERVKEIDSMRDEILTKFLKSA